MYYLSKGTINQKAFDHQEVTSFTETPSTFLSLSPQVLWSQDVVLWELFLHKMTSDEKNSTKHWTVAWYLTACCSLTWTNDAATDTKYSETELENSLKKADSCKIDRSWTV